MLDYFQHAVLLSFHLGFFAFGWVFFYRKLFKDFEVRRPSWLCARGPRARLTLAVRALTLRWPWCALAGGLLRGPCRSLRGQCSGRWR